MAPETPRIKVDMEGQRPAAMVEVAEAVLVIMVAVAVRERVAREPEWVAVVAAVRMT